MSKGQRWYEVSLLPALILGIAFFFLFLLRAFLFNGALWGGKALMAAGSLVISAVMQAYTLALFRREPLKFLRQFAIDNPSNLIRDILATLLITMALYSEFVYPGLPAMFGGGDRPAVRLVMRNQVDLAVLPRVPHRGSVIGPVQIISESADSIFVLPANAPDTESLVRLRRDQVDAIIYEVQR